MSAKQSCLLNLTFLACSESEILASQLGMKNSVSRYKITQASLYSQTGFILFR